VALPRLAKAPHHRVVAADPLGHRDRGEFDLQAGDNDLKADLQLASRRTHSSLSIGTLPSRLAAAARL
jgi:hypothetical protein